MRCCVVLFYAILVGGALLFAGMKTASCAASRDEDIGHYNDASPLSLRELLKKLQMSGKTAARVPSFRTIPLQQAGAICEQMQTEGDGSALVLLYAPHLFPRYDYEQLLVLLADFGDAVNQLLKESATKAHPDENEEEEGDVAALLSEHRLRVFVVDAFRAGGEIRRLRGGNDRGSAAHRVPGSLRSPLGPGTYRASYLENETDADNDDFLASASEMPEDGDVENRGAGDFVAHSPEAELLQKFLAPKGSPRNAHHFHPTVLEKMRQSEETAEPTTRPLLSELPPILFYPATKTPVFLPHIFLHCRSDAPCSSVHASLISLDGQEGCGCIKGPDEAQELLEFVTTELQQMSLETLKERRQVGAERGRRRSWRRLEIPDESHREALLDIYDVENLADDKVFNAPIHYTDLKQKTEQEIDFEYVFPMAAKLRLLHETREAAILKEARRSDEVLKRVKNVLRERQISRERDTVPAHGASWQKAFQQANGGNEDGENHLLLMEYIRYHGEHATQQLHEHPTNLLIGHLEERMHRVELLRRMIRVEEGRGTEKDERMVRFHAMEQEHQRRLNEVSRYLRNMQQSEGT
ncbi:hypothetical protein Tc00.1047053506825.200 [Trypanosoma cruzi]|uniref:Uncharacterized protein n=1 Tax=Trypanosoma cruzi (strain CL Brener) TaxID=353153 RepID=Q4DZE3_TRYCC|nr:hypothetical protein Tc00.1047053506825.200 [Trypanosoma cruzi]EAN97910.1 hypothetical protein Tc00.1047053506825.200 [Trypanosoma cruzi]|eukprot:XP_819761.1 hypothetical protein [Trypanosoma cruzi strain CL Brener]